MDETENIKSISVMIAGRNYPLKINEKEEERIRRIAHDINQKINTFKIKYSSKSKQDWMAMTLLTYANDLDKVRDDSSEQELLTDLSSIDSLLDQLI